jgi:hypothetical protein
VILLVYIVPFLEDVLLRFPYGSTILLSEDMTPQPSRKNSTSGRQPATRTSIAFLLNDQDKAEPIDIDGTQEYCDSVSMLSQMPIAHSSPCIPTCDQTEMDNTLFDTTLAQPDLPHHPYGYYSPQAHSFERDIETSSPSSGHTSSSGSESFGYDPVSLNNDWSTSFHQPPSSVDRLEPYYRHRCHNYHPQIYNTAEIPTREPRSARPPYNEEQKFFIMYYRTVEQLSWPDMEDKFAQLFNLRSKDGLTSAYYRIRGSWGMEQVLKNQARPEDDLDTIERKADLFSRAFLENIGYFN